MCDLPHEAEALRAACERCAEAFDASRRRAQDLRKGIQDTQPFVRPNYQRLGLLVPNEDEVRTLMTARMLKRLETLAKGLRETSAHMEKQAALYSSKLQELTQLPHWQVQGALPALRKTCEDIRTETESNQRFLASLRYFRQ